jgi:hypothetical protein
VHRPMDRHQHRLLICAEGKDATVISPAGTAIWRSTYILNPFTATPAFWTPARLGWNLPGAPNCPSGGHDAVSSGLTHR